MGTPAREPDDKDDATRPWLARRSAGKAGSSRRVLLVLIALRIVNALTIRTFFQPDEYFQSLEPAWAMAFGEGSGAWITWEWKHRLRSAIHPAIFAAVYYVCSALGDALNLSAASRADLSIVAPKVLQAVVAALGDFYTWKTAGRVYGERTQVAWVALALSVCSPWQWFCSTRTLSNCVETTLTISALHFWPWHWSSDTVTVRSHKVEERTRKVATPVISDTSNEPRESLVLLISSLVDRRFYGTWTFPPYRFVHYNIVQSLAVFYGKNDWHYYLSQGLPLLLTTAAPFAAKGLWNALRPDVSGTVSTPLVRIRLQLAVTVIAVVAALSFISHKEVRFIYPLLPILHILSAESLTSFLWPLRSGTVSKQTLTGPRLSLSKGVLVMFLLSTNIAIALYATLVHQSGAISSLDYIRHRHEAAVATSETVSPRTTVGFLMPCHSTPWRSHLVHAGIEAWALGCEPPVGLNLEERTGYVDEADRFYLDPIAFARTEIADAASASRFRFRSIHGTGTRPSDGDLPDCLVFFQQLEGSMKEIVSSMERTAGGLPVEDGKGGYRECWRGFNSHWHDDWRRQGDVVAWCKSCNA